MSAFTKHAPRAICLITAAILLLTFQSVRAAQGDNDQSFGTNGKVVVDFSTHDDYGRGIAVQPDGKIILVGQSGVYPLFHAALVRLNPNGTMDETFGYLGTVVAELDSGGDSLSAVLLQPDGKIVAAGSLLHDNSTLGFVVARFNADGSLDTSFGTNGRTITTFGSNAVCYAVALQPDGKIILGGGSGPGYDIGLNNLTLVRYNPNGSPDQSFGAGGTVTTRFGTGLNNGSRINSILLLPDGKMVVAGTNRPDYGVPEEFALARYNADGSLDTSFGTSGKVSTSLGSAAAFAFGAVLQPDGRIVLAGYFATGYHNHDFALARYDANGTLDPAFGTNGKVITDLFGASDDIAYGLALAPGGKLIAVGRSGQYPNFIFGIARYNSNGQLDPTFGSGGKVQTTFGGSSSTAYSAVLQADGKVLVGGYSGSSNIDFALVRFMGGPALRAPADFDGDGSTDFAVFRPSNGFWYILHQTASTNFTWFGASGDRIVPGDFDGDGKADITIWRESAGTFYVLRSSTGTLRAQAWGQSGDDPTVCADYDGDGTLDFAVYRPSNGTWYILQSTNGALRAVQWGNSTDTPAPADYDGDGKADLSVRRGGASPGDAATFYTLQSASNSLSAMQWGVGTDRVVAGDYDGDGKADLSVWRPSDGMFYVSKSTGGVISTPWGQTGDRVVPGDYDKDGKTDFAVWRESTGTFYVLKSTGGNLFQAWGTAGDVPAAFYMTH